MEMKRINYMLEIDIFRNSSQKSLGVLWGAFKGFGCPKRHPDALLAMTILLSTLGYRASPSNNEWIFSVKEHVAL